MPKEIRVPTIIVIAGYLFYVVLGSIVAENATFVETFVAFTVLLAIQVAIGIVACYLFSMIFGTGLGVLKYAVVKLAAVIIVMSFVAQIVPGGFLFGIVPLLASLMAGAGLIVKFFDLEFGEGMLLGLMIAILNLVLQMAILAWILAAL